MNKSEFIATVKRLRQSYQPSQKGRKAISGSSMLAFVGPSGAGKTTLIDQIGYKHILTDFTRSARMGEVNGVTGFYRQDYDSIYQSIKNGEYLYIFTSFGDEFYGIRASSCPPNQIGTAAILAELMEDVYRKVGFLKVYSIFILPPSLEEWQNRIKNRNSIKERLNEGKRSIQIALTDPEYFFVINDQVDSAIRIIKDYVEKNMIDPDYQRKAKMIAKKIVAQI